MTVTVKAMKRVFELGATQIEDISPDLPLADSIRMLSKTYPQFRHTKVYEEDGVVKDGKIIYTVKLPPAKSNG